MLERGRRVFVNSYAQYPLVLSGGEGRYVWDINGNKYLDMVGGIAVNLLGYNDEGLNGELKRVIDGGLLHCSNLYWNPWAIQCAEKLVAMSQMERVFFCNSGTEANEGAIKMARKFGAGRSEIITMENSFHGRTLGSLSATGQRKYQEAFAPMLEGFRYARYNDIASVKELLTPHTCAIMVEAIQGEGGIKVADEQFLKDLRLLADKHNLLLIFDEVQCGLGRSGHLFAWQISGVLPDIMTLAKGLGSGIPIGAIVAGAKAADIFTPGDHGATFGGNLLATAAANYVLTRLSAKGFLEGVKRTGRVLKEGLLQLQQAFPEIIKEVRGLGLMLGVELTVPSRPIISACMDKGLLIASAGENVLRFVPPLTITEAEVERALSLLKEAF
ncbi:MAG: aspartate aminotransferase family protein [Sphaerochaetaceae bacterium]